MTLASWFHFGEVNLQGSSDPGCEFQRVGRDWARNGESFDIETGFASEVLSWGVARLFSLLCVDLHGSRSTLITSNL